MDPDDIVVRPAIPNDFRIEDDEDRLYVIFGTRKGLVRIVSGVIVIAVGYEQSRFFRPIVTENLDDLKVYVKKGRVWMKIPKSKWLEYLEVYVIERKYLTIAAPQKHLEVEGVVERLTRGER